MATSIQPTESHSALFGLKPQDAPTKNAGSGPGGGIIGTMGHRGSLNTATSTDQDYISRRGQTPDVATGASDRSKPGAGSTWATASQGSGKVNPDRESVFDKVLKRL